MLTHGDVKKLGSTEIVSLWTPNKGLFVEDTGGLNYLVKVFSKEDYKNSFLSEGNLAVNSVKYFRCLAPFEDVLVSNGVVGVFDANEGVFRIESIDSILDTEGMLPERSQVTHKESIQEELTFSLNETDFLSIRDSCVIELFVSSSVFLSSWSLLTVPKYSTPSDVSKAAKDLVFRTSCAEGESVEDKHFVCIPYNSVLTLYLSIEKSLFSICDLIFAGRVFYRGSSQDNYFHSDPLGFKDKDLFEIQKEYRFAMKLKRSPHSLCDCNNDETPKIGKHLSYFGGGRKEYAEAIRNKVMSCPVHGMAFLHFNSLGH